MCCVETPNACLWIIFSPIAERLASGRVAGKAKRQTLHTLSIILLPLLE